jgi:AmmeMemoRadiSam system protein A/AmmeMemoRadiSam system protein B
MKRAYVLPHPPIILPEVGRGEEGKISKTIDAYKRVAREIADLRPDTIIISSPHAPYYADCFYMANAPEAYGDLRVFGHPDIEEAAVIDQDLTDEIMKTGSDLPIYYPKISRDDLDHGCLIPLRFIKELYKDFKLVRLGISTLPSKDHYKLGMAINKACKNLGRKAVYIGSGDLSHVLKDYGPYGYKKEGPIFDEKILDILQRAAFDELLEITDEEADKASQCGLHSFQIMAGALDGYEVKAEKYSYEGPFGVGYAVLSFEPLGKDEGRHFVRGKGEAGRDPYIELARKTIRTYIEKGRLPDLSPDLPSEILENRAGCFVSLNKFGDLRGCIGTIGPTQENLGQEIIRNAIAASTEDPRFPPVDKDEIDKLDISVDILEKPEPIKSMDELDPKLYGVIVSKGYRRGLLLPNLQGVDRVEDQVSIALQKAGISPDEDYEMERFKVIRHEYK